MVILWWKCRLAIQRAAVCPSGLQCVFRATVCPSGLECVLQRSAVCPSGGQCAFRSVVCPSGLQCPSELQCPLVLQCVFRSAVWPSEVCSVIFRAAVCPSDMGITKAFATSDIESKDLCNLDFYSSWEEALPYSTYRAVFGPPCCLSLPRGN